MWETVHIESATGAYDHEKDILQRVGFNTVITAEELGEVGKLGDFDTPLGYYDERGLEHFWKYVDNTINRVPKNRMYLGWMSTTTHTPFRIPSEWNGRKSYVWTNGEWDSVDNWMNAVRWTDDKVKEIILGFRERGLENETLFLMYFTLLEPELTKVTEIMDSHSQDNGQHLSKTLTTKPIAFL